MPEWLRWLLAALATYRLAQLFAIDDGPDDVLLRLRDYVGAYDRDESGRARTSAGRLFGCPYCIGVWAAILCGLLAAFPCTLGDLLLGVLGLAGAQAWLQGSRQA